MNVLMILARYLHETFLTFACHNKMQKVLRRINPPTFLILLKNMLNTLHTHNIEQSCRVIKRMAQRLSQHNLKIFNLS
jgi:hypothetical protein